LLLLAVTLPPTSLQSPIVRLLGGGVGALCVMGTLLLIFGLPAYNSVIDLDDRYQNLEGQYLSLDRRNQFLETRFRNLEDRYQKLEETLKELEGQNQNGLLEEQLPVQRNLAFMEMWSVQRRDLDKAS
jgi:cell division protein FtsB